MIKLHAMQLSINYKALVTLLITFCALLLGRYYFSVTFCASQVSSFQENQCENMSLVRKVCKVHVAGCKAMALLIQKITSFLTRVKDKFIAGNKLDQVVQEYDAFLQYSLVTTSSFQNILDGKLNQRRRALQLTIMLFYSLSVIPRYSFLSLLYLQDEQTRMHYQYILADYAEEVGLLGRTFNVGYVIFSLGIVVNDIIMRKFEGQGSLEFLTDWLKRIPKKTNIEDGDEDETTAPGDLDNESRRELISGLHYKLTFAKIMARNVAKAVQSFELIAFSMFIYNKRPSFFVTCLGLCNCITVLYGVEISGYHYYSLYLSYVVTTDYFKVVINKIMRKVEDLKTKGMKNRNITSILDEYDFMMNDFKNYNRVLKPLLGNLVHFYIFGLTLVFIMFTIGSEVWMLATTVVAAGGYSFFMLATGVYVSQLPAKVIQLHNTLTSLCVRLDGHKRRLSLNCLFRLKHIIQELGSLETDGQFVIGLRDGEGAATSRMEIFNLTMDTLSNTLMILGFINRMDGI